MIQKVEMEMAGKRLTLETGRVARQADGAVLARYADTVVLATAVGAKVAKPDIDFLPLTVDYQEKAYAAGKIPGGFFKREGRPGEKEVLTCRLIDRPLRPLFPKGYFNETQVIASVLSSDSSNSSDILAITTASCALFLSDIPFDNPVGAVRVGRVDGKLIINPDLSELEKSELNLVIAGTRDAVMMVEAGATGVLEEVMLEAIALGHQEIQKLIQLQVQLRELAGKPKREVPVLEMDSAMVEEISNVCLSKIQEAVLVSNKSERQERLDSLRAEVVEKQGNEDAKKIQQIKIIFKNLEKEEVRQMIIEKGIRADGRGPSEIRPITCEVGVLPRTHGSALFTRGDTQSLAVVTLGTSDDEQRIDALEGESKKTFMLHYNFPPFSVGEARPMRGPGRREIGHGVLAERALKCVVPSKEEFPYTLRIVSDILESNGSSSMATVCGGTLALMDAGVPIKSAVAGIAMGLIKKGEQTVILSDILGLEDHLGDMDFKVTGTAEGVTGLQMDIKIGGIKQEVLKTALEQAREGRLYILQRMKEAIETPRQNLSVHAPRIITLRVKPDKVREVIGPGGKVIRGIIEKTGVKIDIDDSGLISIASVDEKAAQEAVDIVNKITEEVEVGKIYFGKVKKIMDFGAFVEILPNTDGLVHISQLAQHRVKAVTDEVKEGDEFLVKVLEVDRQGKIRLSRKEVTPEETARMRKD
ncbi:MAG TPA: polyribonucleotide nucleotidyltransferase [Nitrospiria bacterium]